MMLPFTVIDGEVKIIDKNGNMVDIVSSSISPDSRNRLAVDTLVRGGNDPYHLMDVIETATGKRAKVEAVFSGQGFSIPTLGNKIIYEETDSANGGISRETVIGDTWVTVYNKTGLVDGLFISFLVTLEKLDEPDWQIKLNVDGEDVFGVNGISLTDLQNVNVFGFNSSVTTDIPEFGGFHLRASSFRWEAPNDLPIRINSGIGTIKIEVRKTAQSRLFRAGLVVRASV